MLTLTLPAGTADNLAQIANELANDTRPWRSALGLHLQGALFRASVPAIGTAAPGATPPTGTAPAPASLPAASDPLRLVADAARRLTVMGATHDGAIIVGPVGWHQLQDALAVLPEATP